MGILIRNIDSFEKKLKSQPKRWTILIFANAGSDSKAVDYILRNFHVMDIFSGKDVDFFMPGYDVENGFISQSEIRIRQDSTPYYYPEYAQYEHNCVKVIDSPRLGPILFNQAEFVDFALELTKRNPHYLCYGVCQMVIMPVICGTPDYTGGAILNLDAIINEHCKLSLEQFIGEVFNLIRKANIPSRDRTLDAKMDLINEVVKDIKELYKEATTLCDQEDWYGKYRKEAIASLEKHLKWSLSEPYFFISYSSKNMMKADELRRSIEERGHHVWMAPDGIPQGTEYSLMIPLALRSAKYFVLFLTPDSCQSKWVRRELELAIDFGTIIKVVLGDGLTIDKIRQDDQLRLFLNLIQIRYEFDDIIKSQVRFDAFLND